MYIFMKIMFTLLVVILLSGCRTARQSVMSEASVDSEKIFTNTSLSINHDSIIISEVSMEKTSGIVKFVEGGGLISVTSDGSLVMAGVASMHSSANRASSAVAENVSSDFEIQSKDSLSVSSKKESHSESKANISSPHIPLKKIGLTFFLIILLLVIIKRIKVRRTNSN